MKGPRGTARRVACRLLMTSALSTAISGCWSGRHYAVGPFSYGTDSTGLRTAIVTTYEVSQTAHGPIQIDGPASKIDEFGFLVWMCDAGALKMRSLGLLELGDSVATLEPLTIADWRSADFVVFSPGRAAILRVSIDGSFAALPRSAPDTVHASAVAAPYCTAKLDSLRTIPANQLNGPGGS